METFLLTFDPGDPREEESGDPEQTSGRGGNMWGGTNIWDMVCGGGGGGDGVAEDWRPRYSG